MGKILSGEVQANTDAEVEAAFGSLVERTVAGFAAALKQVDDLNPPLPPHVADNIKAKLCEPSRRPSAACPPHAVRDKREQLNCETLFRN